jgi:hypothetical protein
MIDLDQFAAEALVELVSSDYFGIRQAYYETIRQAVADYMAADEKAAVTTYRNTVSRAVAEQVPTAFETGFTDGGGELPLEPDDESWINTRQNTELAFVDQTFQRLKDLKKSDDPQAIDAAQYDTADKYALTLDGIFNEGKVRAMGNQMLTMDGIDGKKNPCGTCQNLKGQRHRAKWWVDHGLIPGQPGNTNYDCGGWKCQHYLKDDQERLITL